MYDIPWIDKAEVENASGSFTGNFTHSILEYQSQLI